jgi:hypothetical protein
MKRRPPTLTLGDLQAVYHLPISAAAKKFDIGLTLLKKRCRELGLKRWPYRKLKSMDKLLHSIESVDGQDPQVKLQFSWKCMTNLFIGTVDIRGVHRES